MIFRYIFQSACQIEKYELQYLCYKTKLIKEFYRGMAQFGSALDWGSRGHGFKSRYSDHKLRWVHTMYALSFLYPFNLRLRKRWNGYKNEHALRAEVCAVKWTIVKYHKLKRHNACAEFLTLVWATAEYHKAISFNLRFFSCGLYPDKNNGTLLFFEHAYIKINIAVF